MLFVIFILVIPITIWVILHTMTREKSSGESQPEELMEECALCHEAFFMQELLEKEVGEYGRLYCFCGGCIKALYREYGKMREHKQAASQLE